MKAIRLAVVIFVAAGLAACATPKSVEQYFATSHVRVDEVRIKVKRNMQGLEVTSRDNRRCPQGQQLGCIFAGKGDVGVAKFSLRGGGHFFIHKLTVCPNSEAKQDNCTLSSAAGDQFLVVDERGAQRVGVDGVVEFPINRQRSEFLFINLNQDEGEFFYNIIACKDSDGSATGCLELDPLIINEGVGNFF